MSSLIDSQGVDLLDDYREQTQVSPEGKKEFFPWHRPRKQYIRRFQWSAALDTLIRSGDLRTKGRSLSYLGLPGDDMLDVRTLHAIAANHSLKLRYLGFNAVRESRSTESYLSHNELRSQDYAFIDAEASTLVTDPLEDLVDENSLSSQALASHAPYDVVNFDLCNSVGAKSPAIEENSVSALRVILEEQRRSKPDPWLLFVTTRANKNSVNPQVWDLLHPVLGQNVQSSSAFRSLFTQCVGLPNDIVSAQRQIRSLKQDAFCRAFVTGFSKWLIQLALSGLPVFRVSLDSAHAYSVAGGLDMFSLVFRFEKVVVSGTDNTGWTSGKQRSLFETELPQPSVEEPKLACTAVQAVMNALDVDQALSADEALFRTMIDESAALMVEARYDADLYRAWVDGGCHGSMVKL